VPFNVANLIVLPLIIAPAVEGGIMIVYRYRDEARAGGGTPNEAEWRAAHHPLAGECSEVPTMEDGSAVEATADDAASRSAPPRLSATGLGRQNPRNA
jgi:hypothetical protein